MKSDELMIGDLVQIQYPSKVICISQDGIYFKDKEGEGACSFDQIQPIPLTPEILEKNGFEGKEQGHYYRYSFGCSDNPIYIHHQNDKVACSTTDNRNELALFGMIVLTYVHELQHALRLCGIDKEINLTESEK